MPECEHIENCPYFKGELANFVPETVEITKKCYCLKDNSSCARYLVKMAGLPVPDDLSPNDIQTAKSIIAKSKIKRINNEN